MVERCRHCGGKRQLKNGKCWECRQKWGKKKNENQD